MDGKKLGERVTNVVDMTVRERLALLRVSRAAKQYLAYTDNIPETWNEPSELSEALKEVEHLLKEKDNG